MLANKRAPEGIASTRYAGAYRNKRHARKRVLSVLTLSLFSWVFRILWRAVVVSRVFLLDRGCFPSSLLLLPPSFLLLARIPAYEESIGLLGNTLCTVIIQFAMVMRNKDPCSKTRQERKVACPRQIGAPTEENKFRLEDGPRQFFLFLVFFTPAARIYFSPQVGRAHV